MALWRILEPFTSQAGRDYRPGDTFVSDVAPSCASQQLSLPKEKEPAKGEKPR